MATITISSTDNTLELQATISHRNSWDDPWVAIPYCYADRAEVTTGNAIGGATLNYEYGEIQQPDQATFSTYTPLSILGHWIRIQWNPGGATPPGSLYTWYGIATDESFSEHSERTAIQSGTQRIECVAPNWLLTRKQVLDSHVFKELDAGNPVALIAKEGLIFNPIAGGRSQTIKGNRYQTIDTDGIAMFSSVNDSTATTWNAGQAIKYLLQRMPPVTEPLPYEWDISAASMAKCAWHTPEHIVTHGQTLHAIINAILPRSRGFVWWVTVDEAGDKIWVNVDTVLENDLVLPGSGVTVTKNDNQYDIDYDDDAVVSGSAVVTSTQRRYEQVIVEGARRGVVCTLTLNDATPGTTNGYTETWDSADKLAYDDAFSGDAGYGALGTEKQKQYNDALRKSNPQTAKVYSTFTLAGDWDRTARNGAIAYPDVDEATAELTGAPPPEATADVWVKGIRIQPYLPLYADLEYADPEAPTGSLSTRTEFEKALVVVDPDPDNPSSKRIQVDRLHSLSSSERGDVAGSVTNGRVTLDDSSPTFRISSSSQNHIFAHGSYNVATAAVSNEVPMFDYQTIEATFYLTFPDRVRVAEPAIFPLEEHDLSSVLLIRLGERAHADYMPEYTIYRVTDDHDVKEVGAGNSGFVRDDRDQMRDLASMAYEWYGRASQAIELNLRQTNSQLEIGYFIDQIRLAKDVKSVVTHIAWDLKNQTTKIRTDYAELDFGGFFNV